MTPESRGPHRNRLDDRIRRLSHSPACRYTGPGGDEVEFRLGGIDRVEHETTHPGSRCCCNGGEGRAPAGRAGGGSRQCVFWALVSGCLVALPVGWVLATLIMLPFMLGLLFYMLFGLLVGAVVYRVASPAIPVPRGTAMAVGLVVTLAVYGVSLAGEYYNVRGYSLYRSGPAGWAWYPVDGDAMQAVRESFSKRSFAQAQLDELRRSTREAFVRELSAKYPPGGFVGFLRWRASPSRPIMLPRVLGEGTQECKPKRSGTPWMIRMVLAFALLAGAMMSQVLGLSPRPHAPQAAAPTAEGDPPEP